MKQEIDTIVEGLLEKPYWVVDLLPYQVPEIAAVSFLPWSGIILRNRGMGVCAVSLPTCS